MIYIFSVVCFWVFIDKIYSAKFVLQMFHIVDFNGLVFDTWSCSLPVSFLLVIIVIEICHYLAGVAARVICL